MKYTKILTIGLLPIMWIIYFLFELITNKIGSNTVLLWNILLIILFATCGYLIYFASTKFPNGVSTKQTLFLFLILILIDQGIKILIKFFFFNSNFEIVKNFLSFNPIINSNGSWLNARFGTSISFSLLNIINILALLFFFEIYRYFLSKKENSFFINICFLFIFSGALCSLVDKLFYGGSLDFIGIGNLFIADIKDIYINIGILLFIVSIYNGGYLNSNIDTTFKDDLNSISKFLSFAKNDILLLLRIKS